MSELEALPKSKLQYGAVFHGLDYYLRGGERHDFDPDNCEICRKAYNENPEAFSGWEIRMVEGKTNHG